MSIKVNLETKSLKTLKRQVSKYVQSISGYMNQKTYEKLTSQLEQGTKTKRQTVLDLYESLQHLRQAKQTITLSNLKVKRAQKFQRIAVYAHFKEVNIKNKKVTHTEETIAIDKIPTGVKNFQEWVDSKYRSYYESDEFDVYDGNIKRYFQGLSYKIASVDETKNMTLSKLAMKNAFVLNYNWLKYAEGISEKSLSDMQGRCVYDLLVDHLKPRWTTVTKENLFRIFNEFHQQSSDNNGLDFGLDNSTDFTMDSGVNTLMINHLCELKNISLYAFDADEKCFFKRY